MDRKDIDGKEFIRERMDMAKTQSSFWQDYKFVSPISKKIEQKTMYCEKVTETGSHLVGDAGETMQEIVGR